MESRRPVNRLVLCAAFAVFASFAIAAAAWSETPPFNPVGEQPIVVVPLLESVAPGYDPKCAGPASNYKATPRLTADNLSTLFNFSTDFAFFYKSNSYGQTQWDATVLKNPARKDGWWPAPAAHTV